MANFGRVLDLDRQIAANLQSDLLSNAASIGKWESAVARDSFRRTTGCVGKPPLMRGGGGLSRRLIAAPLEFDSLDGRARQPCLLCGCHHSLQPRNDLHRKEP